MPCCNFSFERSDPFFGGHGYVNLDYFDTGVLDIRVCEFSNQLNPHRMRFKIRYITCISGF